MKTTQHDALKRHADRVTPECLSTPTDGNQDIAFSYLEDEHETLLALVIALLDRLEPSDPSDSDSCLDTTSWRLAHVLNDRLSDVGFLKRMHGLMFGSGAPR